MKSITKFIRICTRLTIREEKKTETNVWEIKNSTERFLAQLHSSCLVNAILCLVSNFANHIFFTFERLTWNEP